MIHRIDHIGINVIDFEAAKAFFVALGMEVTAEWVAEGDWVGRIIGLTNVKSTCAKLKTPDSGVNIEICKFHSPEDESGAQPLPANALGIRHLTFQIDDVEGMVAKLQALGGELMGTIHNYENIYKLCYLRGPEGIILELAEKLNG